MQDPEIIKSVNRDEKLPPSQLDPEDEAAIDQAQHEAHERYEKNYIRNYHNRNKKKAGWMTKALAAVYILSLTTFAAFFTMLDMLPPKHVGIIIAVLVIISLLIITELCRSNVRKWIRILMSLACIALITFYSMGISYIVHTMSFLDATTEESDNRVESLKYMPFNIMITGIDVSGSIEEKGRSDVNMLVTVNPNTAQILMTSIPRDYQIYLLDKEMSVDKLTHTGFYGVKTTKLAEENLLMTDINYYIKVNFTTVEKFIDAIGGIDVYSEYSFAPLNNSAYYVQEGMNHMNGAQALAFARDRKSFSEGDNQRIKNQQEVVEAVIKKATSSTAMLVKYNDILTSLKDYFRMSISSSELKDLIKMQISDNPKWEFYKNSLSGQGKLMSTYSTGSENVYVMLQDEESIQKAHGLIKAVMNGKRLTKDKDGNVSIVETEDEETK